MKQTAVEYILNLVTGEDASGKDVKVIDVIDINEIQQANQLFENQITNCFDHGDLVGRASVIREINPNDKVVLKYPEISAEQYYNETFKSE